MEVKRDVARAVERKKAQAQPRELQAPLGTYERYAGMSVKPPTGAITPMQMAAGRGYIAWRLAAQTCPHGAPGPGERIPLVWPCAECLAWAKVVIESACMSRLQELSRGEKSSAEAAQEASPTPRPGDSPGPRPRTGKKPGAKRPARRK